MTGGRWYATGPADSMPSTGTDEGTARLLARGRAVVLGVGRLVRWDAGRPDTARVVEVWHGDRERGPVLAEVYP